MKTAIVVWLFAVSFAHAATDDEKRIIHAVVDQHVAEAREFWAGAEKSGQSGQNFEPFTERTKLVVRDVTVRPVTSGNQLQDEYPLPEEAKLAALQTTPLFRAFVRHIGVFEGPEGVDVADLVRDENGS